VAIVALIYGLSRGQPDGWGSPGTLIPLAICIVAFGVFGMVERRCDAAARGTRLRLTPGAAPLLNDIKLLRANLQRLATSGVNPVVLKTMVCGLRRTDELFRGVDHIAFA